MTLFYYLQQRERCLTSHWQWKPIVPVFMTIIIFSFSSCANLGEKNTENMSLPQRYALSHSTPIAMGRSNRSAIKGWMLTFDDEFNNATLNTGIWNIEDYGKDRYQNCCLYFGSQYFTSRALSLHNGYLHITSRRRNTGNANYTSGAITTENKFSFLYGRVDISARFSGGQGMWPGLWMLTTYAEREVDIMEMVNDPTIVYQTYHLNIPTYNTAVPQCVITDQNLSHAFHVFSVVWKATSLIWYIDGRETCYMTRSIPTTPMYLLLDVAVGGDWPGMPDFSTAFPQSTLIDYVRVYQASLKSPCSGLQVTSPLQLTNTTIAAGKKIAGTVTYTNRCTTPFAFLDLLIAARTSNGRNMDFGNKGPITLQPGQSVIIHASRILDRDDILGSGYAFSSFETPDGMWHSDGTNLVNFTVTN